MGSNPRVGVSLYSYGADLIRDRMSVKECIEHAASLGVEGIEIVDKHHIPNYPYPSVYDLWDLRDYVESFGCKVSCFSSYEDARINAFRRATVDEFVKMIKDHVAVAKLLGAKVNRPTLFCEPGQFPEIMKQIMPVLKEYDIKYGIELHAPLNPQVFLKRLKAINSPYIGIVPDFSAWQTKGLPAMAQNLSLDTFRECMPYAFHVHAKAHVFDENGEEPNAPYDKLLGILKESGYGGYVSAEFEGWWFKDFDSKEIVKTHVNLLKKYL